MASAMSGPQGQRNAHAKMYSLGGNRREEPNKQNPWHKYCKEYATKNNISYAAAISLASPSWRAHKEKNGLSFRDRSRRAEKQQGGEEAMEEWHDGNGDEVAAIHSAPPAERERTPRKPKETFRKDDRKRPYPCGTQPPIQQHDRPRPPQREYEDDEEPSSAYSPQPPKKKRAKKEKPVASAEDDEMEGFREYMKFKKMSRQ